MILVVDNRDSFVFNLARYIELLGVTTVVRPSHALDVAGIAGLSPRAIVISPGPCTPAEAGCSIAAVQAFRGRVPILGVCLGHQAIAAALGAAVVRAREPVHGRTSRVHHDGVNLFAGIDSPLTAARYHSLVVDPATLPPGIAVTARDDDGTVMALEHAADGLYGVQFHPESILTPAGFRLLANFLDLAGIPHRADIPTIESQLLPTRSHDDSAAERVVTF
ncbi:MAG: aminodeoxychorismate/anthranilate synthase component II [Planctomycetia bacterium]|nr:aminodeoxychorismate/anthranilate synthase component II [Planctomycetia bacterium]